MVSSSMTTLSEFSNLGSLNALGGTVGHAGGSYGVVVAGASLTYCVVAIVTDHERQTTRILWTCTTYLTFNWLRHKARTWATTHSCATVQMLFGASTQTRT